MIVQIKIIEQDGSEIIIGHIEESWWTKEIGIKLADLIHDSHIKNVITFHCDTSIDLVDLSKGDKK